MYRNNHNIPADTQTIVQLITHPRSNTRPVAVDGSNNDTISHGEEAGGSGAPVINNDTIGCGEEAVGGSAPAINNDTISRG